MSKPDREELIASLRGALRQPLGQGGDVALTSVLSHAHPAEIVDLMHGLTFAEALAVFNWLDNARAAEVLDKLDPETVRYLTNNAPAGRIAALLDHMAMDDAAEVVSEAHPDRAASLLAELDERAPEDAEEVRHLLSFPNESAGRLMTDKFAAVTPAVTAAQALDYLRKHAGTLETVNELYVLDEERRLLGIVPIRNLIIADPVRPVREFMTPDPISVSPDTDQQEVARLISRYDLLTLPVTDHTGRMVGIVTIDDGIDALVEGFEGQFLKTVGSGAEELQSKSPARVALLRMPWIMAALAIELVAALVIHAFDTTLIRFILLASFIPVIGAVSGNTGSQSAASMIRGLSSGHVRLSDWAQCVGRQMVTTVILGGACAAALGLVGALWAKSSVFGGVVFLAMFMAVNVAGVVGTVLPLISKRAGADPAMTAGPVATAFQDVIGITIFLSLASLLLKSLG